MGIPIFGINIPAPKIKIDKTLLEKYADLYRGIRDRKDTVSWRTLIVSIRELLGEKYPDYKKVSHREPLIPEIEYAVGIRSLVGRGGSDLDLLLIL